MEEEWIETLAAVSYNELIYDDFIQVGKNLSHELKNKYVTKLTFYASHWLWLNFNSDVKLI